MWEPCPAIWLATLYTAWCSVRVWCSVRELDVVGKVQDVPRLKPHCLAAEHEAVGPFTAPASPCLQQLDWVVIPAVTS